MKEAFVLESRCLGSRKFTSVCWNNYFFEKNILGANVRNIDFMIPYGLTLEKHVFGFQSHIVEKNFLGEICILKRHFRG